MNKQLPKEWWTIDNPSVLLRYCTRLHTPRKLRLFAVHCCRRLKPWVNDPLAWQAQQTATDFADGKASPEQLREAWLAVRQALGRVPLATRWEYALNALLHASSPQLTLYDVENAAREAALADHAHDIDYIPLLDDSLYESFGCLPQNRVRHQEQCQLIRDLFPFRPVQLDPDWLAWEQGQLPRLALAIYQEEQFQDLPVLADALEEAGCDNPLLLEHARSPGPHYRGCWLLDALLRRR
jgi:hypothetical protein